MAFNIKRGQQGAAPLKDLTTLPVNTKTTTFGFEPCTVVQRNQVKKEKATDKKTPTSNTQIIKDAAKLNSWDLYEWFKDWVTAENSDDSE